MKKARKLGLQSLALVLMAFVLVAGVAFGMTGAWFTSSYSTPEASFTFGEVTIDTNNAAWVAVNVDRQSFETDAKRLGSPKHIMPGDHITLTCTVTNQGEAAYVYMTYTATIAGTDNTLETPAAYNENLSTKLTVNAPSGWTALDGHAGVYYKALANGDTAENAHDDEQACNFDYNLAGETFGDKYENGVITVNVEFHAIQQANLATPVAGYVALGLGE